MNPLYQQAKEEKSGIAMVVYAYNSSHWEAQTRRAVV
jgi:membrane-bound lytic murein transglycosylase MltF